MAYLWKLSVVHFPSSTIVNGTVLEGDADELLSKQSGNFSIVSKSYFKKALAGKEILIRNSEETVKTLTDDYGEFTVEVSHQKVKEVEIYLKDESIALKPVQTYPVYFEETEGETHIVSDIDDTMLVSYTASFWKRIKTILFVSPKKRRSVGFTIALLKYIKDQKGRVFYVSKSETNLFNLISSFIEIHDIPAGNLSLTPYLSFGQLFRSKKGKHYKEAMIKKIIDRIPNGKFILVGDDTQQDMAAYATIAASYPDRILKIYIRKTQKNLVSKKNALLQKLDQQTVPFLYFSDSAKVSKEIDFISNQQKLNL